MIYIDTRTIIPEEDLEPEREAEKIVEESTEYLKQVNEVDSKVKLISLVILGIVSILN